MILKAGIFLCLLASAALSGNDYNKMVPVLNSGMFSYFGKLLKNIEHRAMREALEAQMKATQDLLKYMDLSGVLQTELDCF